MAGLSRVHFDPGGRVRVLGRVTAVALAASCAFVSQLVAAGAAHAAVSYTAYVANRGSGTLTAVNTATNATSSTIAVKSPPALAITPDGSTAWVVDENEGTLTPITLPMGTLGSASAVGGKPNGIAITPDGKTAYVANSPTNTVTPVNLPTGAAGTAIAVGTHPDAIAITPDGKTAYVTNEGSSTVTPIDISTNTPGTPINVGNKPAGIAITPDGTKAYVTISGSNTVVPITLSTNTPGTPISVGNKPMGIAITPDGTKAYVANAGANTVTPIALSTNTPGTPIGVGARPIAIAITPDQATAYVADYNSNVVTPVNLTTNTAGTNITVGTGPESIAITPDQAPVATFTDTPGVAGTASSFDASASSVAYGSITNYHWNFGDGEIADTATPTTIHTYSAPGSYTVTLTETDSAGTSTTKVFTGQTMSRNGGANAQSSHGLTIVPPPPVNTSPPTITGTAQQGQKLTEHNGSWTNGPTSYAYQWLQCDSLGNGCLPIAGATGQTYVAAAEDVGHTLRVQETATNAGGSSSPATSAATAVVVPPPPANTAPPNISGLAQQGQTLTEAHGSWTNSPTGYAYQWLRCDGKGEGCVAIAEATNQTYAPVEADVAHTLRVQETATNAGGSSSPVSSAASAAVVPPGAPVNTVPPTISGTAEQGQTLTEHQGTWTNSPTGYAYQWLRCDSQGEGCTAIAAAASQTYVPVEADVGHTLRVQETASNAVGAGSPADSGATAVVLPPPPQNSALPTITGTAQQGQTLAEQNGSWTNNPTGYAYQWLRCDSSGNSCVPVSGATSQTYGPVAADVGHALRVQESASNAGGTGGPATSAATAAVLPAAPEDTSPPTITGSAQQGQTLTEAHGSWTNSPTGYAYQWLRCDGKGEGCMAIAEATNQTYAPVQADVAHTLRVQETATNAGGSSSPASSAATAVVVPPPPVNAAPPSITGLAEQGHALTELQGSWTYSPTGYAYQWLRCDGKGEGCVAIAGATNQTYAPVEADVAHTLRVQETATNAGGAGSPAESPATALVEAAPAAATASQAPGSSTPASQHAPGDPPAPLPTRVVISSKSVTVTPRGDVLIWLSCPRSAVDGCKGTITLSPVAAHTRRSRARAARCTRGCRSLGSARYEARAGQRIRVRVHMASFGRRLLARRKALRATLSATNVSNGATARTSLTITLRAHRRA